MRKRWATWRLLIAMLGTALAAVPAQAQTVRHVWQGSPSPDGSYLSWTTAARNIQDAIDAASPGDTIWVTNGVYDTGGVAGYPTGSTQTNRVSIYKPVTVQSVNGPLYTSIVGRWHVPGDTNNLFGSEAVRCVYMTNNAVLAGFTVTNGAASSGSGVWSESMQAVVTNCVIAGNRARSVAAGAYRCTLYNSTIRYNFLSVSSPPTWGEHGGGIQDCTLYSCSIMHNFSPYAGGGMSVGTMYNCTVISNICLGRGGGVDRGILYNCLVMGNTGNPGGGLYYGYGYGVTYNSIIVGNYTAGSGGGVSVGDWIWGWYAGPALYNCLVVGNIANYSGAGVFGSGYLYNCTVTGNSSASWGGAAGAGTAHTTNWNTIVYNNVMANNDATNQWRNQAWFKNGCFWVTEGNIGLTRARRKTFLIRMAD